MAQIKVRKVTATHKDNKSRPTIKASRVVINNNVKRLNKAAKR